MMIHCLKFCHSLNNTNPHRMTLRSSLLLRITDPSSCLIPAAPQESLARVNNHTAASSHNRQYYDEEDRGSCQEASSIFGDIFGDTICKKETNTLRIAFQNIGGFPIDKGKCKEETIRQGITKWEFDIFGCAETNIDWRKVPEKNKLFFRTKEWWESLHISSAHNCAMKPMMTRQFGGTAIFSIGKASHRVVEEGCNNTKLGRWTWTRYKGKNNHTLRVISGYRPNPPAGPFTVYAQQNANFHSIGKPKCPRTAFIQDLSSELQKFLDTGDHIVLMLDGNSNMKHSDLKSALKALSLRELILDKHGMDGPSTFRHNNTIHPIDGVWAFPNIHIKAGGYFAYDEVFLNTNYHCLRIDFSYENAFGHIMPAIVKPQARRLHCRDPRVVKKYVQLYRKCLLKRNVSRRLQRLKDIATYPLSSEGKSLYEDIDSDRCQGVRFAEKKCRKLRMGQVAFFPQLQQISRIVNA
jgi:hypothetical protein